MPEPLAVTPYEPLTVTDVVDAKLRVMVADADTWQPRIGTFTRHFLMREQKLPDGSSVVRVPVQVEDEDDLMQAVQPYSANTCARGARACACTLRARFLASAGTPGETGALGI